MNPLVDLRRSILTFWKKSQTLKTWFDMVPWRHEIGVWFCWDKTGLIRTCTETYTGDRCVQYVQRQMDFRMHTGLCFIHLDTINSVWVYRVSFGQIWGIWREGKVTLTLWKLKTWNWFKTWTTIKSGWKVSLQFSSDIHETALGSDSSTSREMLFLLLFLCHMFLFILYVFV